MNKVKIGFFSFTEVTSPAEQRSYNEWHHLDHIPENRVLPGIAHGERWVSTPACTEARIVSDPSIAPIHYMTCYLMTEPINETLRDFLDLGARMSSLGRFHRHRKAYLGGPFSLVKAYAAPRVLVSPEAIPYRPARGVFVIVSDLLDPSQEDTVVQWYDQVHIPDMLTVRGVAGAYWFVNRAAYRSEMFASANPPGRAIRVYYLDDDPLAMVEDLRSRLTQWRQQGRMLDLSGAVKTLFAGPLEAIRPFEYDWFDGESRG